MLNLLTEAKLRSASGREKAYKLTDGGGLHVLVTPTGKKLFRYRFRLGGRESMYAIGEYPIVGLSKARQLRNDAQRLVAEGLNPSHARSLARREAEQSARNTFKSVADDWIERKTRRWSPSYLHQIRSLMQLHVFPILGRRPVAEISANEVRLVLDRINKTAPTVATLLRIWCSQVFRVAVSCDLASIDPVAALKDLYPREESQHHLALGKQDVFNLLRKLEDAPGTQEVNIAIRILLLTFVRPGELRQAKWQEFDFEEGTWNIPASRMKSRKPHLVPLSDQTSRLFKSLRRASSSEYLFPNVRDPERPMSPTTFNRFLERLNLGLRFSAHGFRATASTFLHEADYPSELIEQQLAHVDRNKIRATYNHARRHRQRKEMMQNWADFIDSIAENWRRANLAISK